MPLFIDPKATVPVTVGEHTVYIRAKMSGKVRAAVQDEMRARGFRKDEDVEVSGMGSYRLALLIHNIVKWEGPDFQDVPCTRQNIERIDPQDELWEKVAEEIGERNEPKELPEEVRQAVPN